MTFTRTARHRERPTRLQALAGHANLALWTLTTFGPAWAVLLLVWAAQQPVPA